MKPLEIIEGIKAITEVIKLNQHQNTMLSPTVKKQAEKTISLLLQLLG